MANATLGIGFHRAGWEAVCQNALSLAPSCLRYGPRDFICRLYDFRYIHRVNRLTKQELWVLCIVVGLLLTGWAVKAYRTAHPSMTGQNGLAPAAQPAKL